MNKYVFIVLTLFGVMSGFILSEIFIKPKIEQKDLIKEMCNPYVVELYNDNIVVCKSVEGYTIKERKEAR